MKNFDWLFSCERSSSCPSIPMWHPCFTPAFSQHWVSWTALSIEDSRCWHSSSSFSQCRWSLLPTPWFWCSDSASSGVTSDGRVSLLSIGLGSQHQSSAGAKPGWLTQQEEFELCSPRPGDNKWQRCCCTGGGRGRHHLICCLLGGNLAAWVEQVLSCPSLPRVSCSHLHYARSWRRQAAKKEIRSKGCEEQVVAFTPDRGFAGTETQGAEWMLLLQHPATLQAAESLCSMKRPQGPWSRS